MGVERKLATELKAVGAMQVFTAGLRRCSVRASLCSWMRRGGRRGAPPGQDGCRRNRGTPQPMLVKSCKCEASGVCSQMDCMKDSVG